jgi:hypothetical protein
MADDRVKQEIEEILERVDDRGRRQGTGPRFRKPGGGGKNTGSLTGWFVVISVVLLITALVFRNMFLPLALAGVALLLIGYWLAMRSRRGGPPVRITRIEQLITPGRLLVAALILLVLGLVPPLRGWFPYLGLLAFFLFLWAYWIAWPRRGSARGVGQRWRGQVIDYPESFWAKVRRWIRGR